MTQVCSVSNAPSFKLNQKSLVQSQMRFLEDQTCSYDQSKTELSDDWRAQGSDSSHVPHERKLWPCCMYVGLLSKDQVCLMMTTGGEDKKQDLKAIWENIANGRSGT